MNPTPIEHERIADRYEALCRTGQWPDLLPWLEEVPVEQRPDLAAVLIAVEWDYRCQRGELGTWPERVAGLDPATRDRVHREWERLQAEPSRSLPCSQAEFSKEAVPRPATQQAWRPGDYLGPYELLSLLGSGGMGEVWMAEQAAPVKRRVAVKLIKSGLQSSEILVRFEAERQALALMNHPNIARILDAGTWQPDSETSLTTSPERQRNSPAKRAGQPYFVMEWVPGVPLTNYCDQHRLSVTQRLQLFLDVCSGVQHAHQKGIIHRDLKPSNILVAQIDGQAVPKIIDFGLAKALDTSQRLTDQSLLTGIGQLLGTLRYMSPEQASLDNLDVDTRADIYALGVILYELLTGSTPLDDSSIKGQAALKVLELIRDQDAVRPSRRLLTTAEETVSLITQQRRTDRSRLNRLLLGDLDWIVMKALDKDRARRYDSASNFASDIRRHLTGEPVVARPPSLSYRIRKFVRRNRVEVFAAGIVALALLGAIVGTTTAMLRAFAAEELADQERKVADQRRKQAEINETIAREQSQLALTTLTSVVTEIQVGLRDIPGSAPIRQQLLNISLDKLQSVSTQFLAQTAVDESTWAALGEIGDVILRFGVAESEFAASASIVEQPTERTTAVALAEAYYQRGYEIARSLTEADPSDAAKQLLLLFSHRKLGDAYLKLGRTDDAIAQQKFALQISRSVASSDPNNPQKQRDESTSNDILGDIYLELGRTEEALVHYKNGMKITQRLVEIDPHNPEIQRDLSISLEKLGDVSMAIEKPEQAMVEYEESFKIRQSLAIHAPLEIQSSRDDIAILHGKRGDVFQMLKRPEDALVQYELDFKIRRSLTEADPSDTQQQYDLSVTCNRIGDALLKLDRIDEALSQYEYSLEIRRNLAETDPHNMQMQRDLSISHDRLGTVFLTEQQVANALIHYHQSLKIRNTLAERDPNNPAVLRGLMVSHYQIARAETAQDRFDTAEAHYLSAIQILDEMITKNMNATVARQEKHRMEELLRSAQRLKIALADWSTVTSVPALDLPDVLATRAIELYRRQKFSDAELAADELCSLTEATSDHLYNMACIYSLCSAVIVIPGVDATPEAGKPTLLKDELLSKAVRTLRKAIDKGWTDFERLQADKKLDPIRDRPDFAALLPGEIQLKSDSDH